MSLIISKNRFLTQYNINEEIECKNSLYLYIKDIFYQTYIEFYITENQLNIINSKKTLTEQIKVFTCIIETNDFFHQNDKFNITYDMCEHNDITINENLPFTFLRND